MSSRPPLSSRRVQRPVCLLIVDDDVLVLRGLQRSLGQMRPEWEILTAESAARALELLRSRTVDVLLTDLHMPQMHGVALLRAVMQAYPHVWRVAHSSSPEAFAGTPLADVAQDIVVKPVKVPELVERLSRAIDRPTRAPFPSEATG